MVKLAEMFGVPPYLIVGFLIAWWDYCAEMGENGEAAKCPSLVLAQLALPVQKAATNLQIPDMLSALRKTRLASRDGRPHDWQDYAGALLTRRAKEKMRKRLARAVSAVCPADSPAHVATKSRERVEKRKAFTRDPSKKQQPERMTGDDLRNVFGQSA